MHHNKIVTVPTSDKNTKALPDAADQAQALDQTIRAVSMIMLQGLQSLVQGSNTLPADTSLDALRERQQYTQSAAQEAIHLRVVEHAVSLLPVEPFLSNVKQDHARLVGVSRYTLRDHLARKHDLNGSRVEKEHTYDLYPCSVAGFPSGDDQIGILRLLFSHTPSDTGIPLNTSNSRLAVAGILLWMTTHHVLDTVMHTLSTAWNTIADRVDPGYTLHGMQQSLWMHYLAAYHDATHAASVTDTPWDWQEPLQLDAMIDHIGDAERLHRMVIAQERLR